MIEVVGDGGGVGDDQGSRNCLEPFGSGCIEPY